MYKLLKPSYGQTEPNCVYNIENNLYVPFDPNNKDYQIYLKWLDGYEYIAGSYVKTSEGNTPLPADEPNEGTV